jgi:glycosyltransferase involved in cell wall biosynthesis
MPIRYYKCFDMGIFPSAFSGETFPLFLLECFQAGLPAISTDIGEIPSIMGEQEAFRPGYTVLCQNDSAKICREMVEILSKMIKRPDEVDRLKTNAIAASKRFSIDRLADLYAQIFRELLSVRTISKLNDVGVNV